MIRWLTAFHWTFWLKFLFLLTHIYTNIYSRNSWKISSDTTRHTSIPVKGCHYKLWTTLVFLASREEEFHLGPLTRLDHSELLCNKVLIKYKRDRESFWHNQQGAKRVPPLLVFSKRLYTYSVQFSSVAQSCPTLLDPMNCSTPGLPVHQQLLEFSQTHLHRVSDAIQPSHPLSSPSPPAPNPSQQKLTVFQWVNSLHEVDKVLEFHLQHQSFQWTLRTSLF